MFLNHCHGHQWKLTLGKWKCIQTIVTHGKPAIGKLTVTLRLSAWHVRPASSLSGRTFALATNLLHYTAVHRRYIAHFTLNWVFDACLSLGYLNVRLFGNGSFNSSLIDIIGIYDWPRRVLRFKCQYTLHAGNWFNNQTSLYRMKQNPNRSFTNYYKDTRHIGTYLSSNSIYGNKSHLILFIKFLYFFRLHWKRDVMLTFVNLCGIKMYLVSI